MADVQSRPATRGGRGGGRAGRGGYSSRGGGRSTSTRHTNGDATALDSAENTVSLDDQGELGKLKKQYLTETVTLKEMFPDWTDDDLVFALQETDGDLPTTIERISEGNISRFADVKKKTKERSKPKATDAPTTSSDKPFGSVRGRGRGGIESARGGRGRGSDRGARGGARGGRVGASRAGAPSSSTTAPAGEASADSTAAGWADTAAPAASGWDEAVNTTTSDGVADSATTTAPENISAADKPATTGAWGATTERAVSAAADHTATPAPEAVKTSLIPEGTKKSWASMFAQPKPQPVLPKAPSAQTPAVHNEPEPAPVSDLLDPVVPEPELAESSIARLESTPEATELSSTEASTLASADLTPPKDDLTEENLEALPDVSHPLATETVVSTRDPRSAVASTVGPPTPKQLTAQQPIGRPAPVGGFAATALKATQPGGRSVSYNRRLLDQTEAVVLPKDHAVERTAVQFGSVGLGGDKPSDVDDEREDAETRTQPPQQSPAAPRASLPPVQQAAATQDSIRDTAATPKAAPGLPPASQHSQQALGLGGAPSSYGGQYGRYSGPGALGQEQVAAQKPYDPFGQQLNYPQGQSDNPYPSHQQAQSTHVSQPPGHHGATSLSQNDYASQYGDHQRSAYQSFYGGSYGQQHQQQQVGAQDPTHPPQRSASNMGASESAYGSHAGQAQSRFNEATAAGSGQNTPAPTSSAQQAGPPSHTGHAGHGQGHHAGGGYPYQNPYYGNSYYNSYMNQYPSQYAYNQQGYGGPYGGGKGQMYGQPHHGYGVSPQASYDQHSSSPANVGGSGGSAGGAGGRDSAFGSSLNEYSRSGSTQPSQAPSQPSGFGTVSDSFGGRQGGFGGQGQSYGQTSSAGDDSSMKAFHEKTGPSPSLGQPGRTGSAMNNNSSAQSQSNYPPQAQGSQGFGGYPNHFNSYGSQHGGLGGLGGQSGSHQQSGYGGAGGFNQYGSQYGSYNQRGWGGNYGH